MADSLRDRLAPIFACRCDPCWTDRKLHAPDCIEELLEDVLDRTADWLLAEAEKELAVPETAHTRVMRRVHRSQVLEALAHSITESTEEPT